MTMAFDRRQYWLLVGLLRTLGSRRELTAQFGMHGPALGILAGLGLLMGGFVSLIILSGRVPARDVLLICQTMTALLLVPLLVSEAADALLNPAEISVLGHRPVGNLTYLAAKATYLIGFAVLIAVALNVLPAIAGLRLEGTAWFYPLTHLAAATLGAIFTALATCGAFGVLTRVVSVARVRSVALWTQLLAGVVVPMAPHLGRLLDVDPDFDTPIWSAVPVTWFAAIGLIGQGGRPPIAPAYAVPGVAASAVLVALGIRALTQGYMTRVSTVMRSRARRPSARRWLPRRPGSVRPEASRLGSLVFRMAIRDWQFRRAGIRSAVPLLILVVALAGGQFRSPFADGAGLSSVHLLPYVVGFTAIAAADFLPFSDHYRARWILLTVPASGLRRLVRAALGALWLYGAMAPAALLFIVAAVWWGIRDAALYALCSAASLSFLVCAFAWVQSGLPFTRPPDPRRAAGNMGIILATMTVMLILAAIQAYFVFPHAIRVIGMAIVMAGAAWAAAHFSLRVLESRVPAQLDEFVSGPNRLFASVRDGDAG